MPTDNQPNILKLSLEIELILLRQQNEKKNSIGFFANGSIFTETEKACSAIVIERMNNSGNTLESLKIRFLSISVHYFWGKELCPKASNISSSLLFPLQEIIEPLSIVRHSMKSAVQRTTNTKYKEPYRSSMNEAVLFCIAKPFLFILEMEMEFEQQRVEALFYNFGSYGKYWQILIDLRYGTIFLPLFL